MDATPAAPSARVRSCYDVDVARRRPLASSQRSSILSACARSRAVRRTPAPGCACSGRGSEMRVLDAARSVGEAVVPQRNAMPGKLRRQDFGARDEVLARLLVRRGAEPPALRVTEDAGEEHVGVLAVRLEQDHVGVRVLAAIFLHADLHPRMDDRAEGLRQNDRQPALVQLRAGEPAVLRRPARIERNERIHAKQQARRLRRARRRRAASC